MNGKSLIVLLIIVVALGGGYMLLKKGGPVVSPTPTALATATVSPSPSSSPTPLVSVGASVTLGPVKTFTVTGKPFSFSPSEIKVKKGDMVKIIFKNTEGIHDWVIDEFNARTPKIQAGQSAEIQFVADKKGTFEYYCSVGSHRQQGMKGKLIVE
jgi:plastocyanin